VDATKSVSPSVVDGGEEEHGEEAGADAGVDIDISQAFGIDRVSGWVLRVERDFRPGHPILIQFFCCNFTDGFLVVQSQRKTWSGQVGIIQTT